MKLLKLDFLNDHFHYQRKNHKGKQEIIAKALGISKGITTVIDATCGLAEDSIFLCQLGFRVIAFERSPEIYNLLHDAYLNAVAESPENVICKSLKIIHQDSILFFKNKEYLTFDQVLDFSRTSIYLDPMFPEKKKSALPRKEMQIFREIVGSDLDADELIRQSLNAGCDLVLHCNGNIEEMRAICNAVL